MRFPLRSSSLLTSSALSSSRALVSLALAAALASAGLPAAAQTAAAPQAEPQKTLPPLQKERPLAVDIQHLALDLKFDWKTRQAYGVARITLKPLAATNEVSLDGAALKINSIALGDGAPLKFAYSGGAEDGALKVTLDRAYKPSETLTLAIDYRTTWENRADPNNIWGSFGKGLRFFQPTTTTPSKRKQIWSFGEPRANRYWFPGIDAPNDPRTTELTATVEKPLTVISNGDLVSTVDNKDGTRTFRWRAKAPHQNHQTSIVVGEFDPVVQKSAGIDLYTYGYPDERQAVIDTVVEFPAMAKFYSDYVGPFRGKRYSQVMVQDFPGGAANAGTATITENMIDDYITHADYLYLWDPVEAQMLASQWFGVAVAPRDWSNVWLGHALFYYMNGLYSEKAKGRDEFLLWQFQGDQAAYLGDWAQGVRQPIVTRNYDDIDAFVSNNYSIIRGGLVLHMLRKEIGEDAFRKTLRQFYKRHAGGLVTTADFVAAAEAASGRELDWFFDQWLYKMGHPVFEVTKAWDEASKTVTLKVKQTQQKIATEAYPQADLFRGKMDIAVDGVRRTVEIAAAREQSFTFPSPSAPKLVNFDVENSWIKELKFERTLDELLYQFQNDADILGRRTAMLALVARANDKAATAAEKESIYAAFRSVMADDRVYWRLRMFAISQLQGLKAPGSLAWMNPNPPADPVDLDAATRETLKQLVIGPNAWLRARSIGFLGLTRDAQYTDLYLAALDDKKSERVVNAAAHALGLAKSPKAFDALAKLYDRPSWKGQTKISALIGLKTLGDPRGAAIALKAVEDNRSPRWWLATPVWDYPLQAADTLAALGKGALAYPVMEERLKASIAEDDVNDIFANLTMIATLGDPRGRSAVALVKERFKDDEKAVAAADALAAQLETAIEAAKKK
jgi:aminopeptidase N